METSWPVSRVLSRTVIHLGPSSPVDSSDLPESSAGHTNGFLFGLAPGGVYLAATCYHSRGALLPHPFTLTLRTYKPARRSTLCCTFRRLAPPRRYLAPCPEEPGLSSRHVYTRAGDCPANSAVSLRLCCRSINPGFEPAFNPAVGPVSPVQPAAGRGHTTAAFLNPADWPQLLPPWRAAFPLTKPATRDPRTGQRAAVAAPRSP